MTDAAANKSAVQKPLPSWIVSGVLGLVLGGGGTFMGLHYFGYNPEGQPSAGAGPSPGGTSPGGMGGTPGGGMGGAMMGGGGMGGGGMGGGGMGGGGMGGGGMGGGGSRGKRNLTTLVGKLDLASKGISFQLDREKSAKLASELAQLEQSEKMTQEEAQERCDALEAVLTNEQKETLALFELPRGGGAGDRPATAAGGGGPPPAGTPGGTDDDNPFQAEANQTRLQSLLGRLQGPAEKTQDEGSE